MGPRFLLPTLALAAGCGSDQSTPRPNPTAGLTLTFNGGDTFEIAHAGQNFGMAVVDLADTAVTARISGIVPGGDWARTFGNVLTAGAQYELRLWVDSNFGGGSPGVCDASPFRDHQWAWPTGVVSDHLTLMEMHTGSGTFVDVCNTPFP